MDGQTKAMEIPGPTQMPPRFSNKSISESSPNLFFKTFRPAGVSLEDNPRPSRPQTGFMNVSLGVGNANAMLLYCYCIKRGPGK